MESAADDMCDHRTAMETRLPPGPPLPRLLQTLGFILLGPRFLAACRKRYGGAVTFGTLFDSRFVMLFDPELVKELFRGPHEQLNAGEANALLGPVLGERSVLLLDGAEHLRHRRLMLPHLHGQRMQAYAQTMREATDREIDSWPVDEPFALLPRMQSLTLGVIMRAVFGYEPGAAEEELRGRLRAMVDPLARPRGIPLMMILGRLGSGDRGAFQRFEAQRRAVDELLYAEIARRREEPDLAERDDVFSALLLAEDEDGVRLSDREVRDELVTLLLAGHETTATGLAWTFDLLLHCPEALERAAGGDDEYLDAVVKESLRIRPVIPGVGRVVRGAPFRLGEWVIPPGVEINPSIRMIHRREDVYPAAEKFRPERFLGSDAPDTYTWVPFGGGTRRCIGAAFAQMEMRIVIARVLERASLRAADAEPEDVQFRAITLSPRNGTRVVMTRAPSPVTESASPVLT
jgi:cytochrome P450